jgi:demethylmenaquinone methyltransferase/2-methoxy-6-polyprenyl-1,4-benzoquinol methylase
MQTGAEKTSAALAPRGGSGQMFDAIAPRYDLLNRLMSFGVDQRWRKRAVRALSLPPGGKVLDLATGTADVAILIARRHHHEGVTVVGLDPSVGMLDVGRRKVAAAGLADRVRLDVGDAQAIPAPDRSFHGVSIAFGIRNVPDRARALAEMARVTRLGGRVVVLELSEPRRGLLGPLARFHIHTVVPRLGAWLSGAREYRYLQASIAAFPPADEFAAMMRAAGLAVLEVIPLTFGVAHLYVGTPMQQGALA